MNIEQAVLENQALIGRAIGQLKIGRTQSLYEDLIQDGNIALMKAFKAFDAERGIKFSTFAYSTIMNELKTSLWKNHNTDISVNMPQQIHEMIKMKKEGMDNTSIAKACSNDVRRYTGASVDRAISMYSMNYVSKDDEDNSTDENTIDGGHNDVLTFLFIDQMLQKKVLNEKEHTILTMHVEGFDAMNIAEKASVLSNHVSTYIARIIKKIRPYYLEEV